MLKFLTELPMENSFKIPNRISNASFFDIDGLGCRLDPPFRRVALSPITSESSILFLEVFIHHREWKCIPCFQKYPSQSLSKMRLSFRRPAPTHPWLRWPCPPKLPRLTVPEWPIGPRGTFSHPQNTCHLKYSPSNTFQIPPLPLNPQKLCFFLVSAESKVVNFHKYKVMNILWGSIFIGTFKICSKQGVAIFFYEFFFVEHKHDVQARGVAQGVQCPLLDARVPKSGLTLWKCCWLSSVNAPPPPQLLGRPHSLVSCRVACREVGARPTLAQDCTVWHCSAAVAAERRVELYQQLTDGGAHHTSSHPGPPLHQWPASKNDMFTHTPFLRSWMVETHFYTNRSSFHW